MGKITYTAIWIVTFLIFSTIFFPKQSFYMLAKDKIKSSIPIEVIEKNIDEKLFYLDIDCIEISTGQNPIGKFAGVKIYTLPFVNIMTINSASSELAFLPEAEKVVLIHSPVLKNDKIFLHGEIEGQKINGIINTKEKNISIASSKKIQKLENIVRSKKSKKKVLYEISF